MLPGRKLLLIDGLDEFDRNDRPNRLCSYLKALTASNANLLVCISSRPSPWLELQFKHAPLLQLHDLTVKDMNEYARAILEDEFASVRPNLTEQEFSTLTTTIVEKASGVFLWVKYAVHTIAEGLMQIDTFEMLQQRLQTLPDLMSDLYTHMWERRGNMLEHRAETSAMFNLLPIAKCNNTQHLFLRGGFPLLFEMAVIFDEMVLAHYTTNFTPLSASYMTQKSRDMKAKVMIRTAGLLQWQSVVQGIAERRSQLLDHVLTYFHLTAQQFLWATEFGKDITTMSDELMRTVLRKFLCAQVAFMIQACRISISMVAELCRMIGDLERRYGSSQLRDTIVYLDTFLKETVLKHFPPLYGFSWVHRLQIARHKNARPLLISWPSLLIEHDAMGCAQDIIENSILNDTDLTLLLARMTLSLLGHLNRDITRGQCERKVTMMKWLLEAGAKCQGKVGIPCKVNGVHRLLRWSPLDILVSTFPWIRDYAAGSHLSRFIDLFNQYIPSDANAPILMALTGHSLFVIRQRGTIDLDFYDMNFIALKVPVVVIFSHFRFHLQEWERAPPAGMPENLDRISVTAFIMGAQLRR